MVALLGFGFSHLFGLVATSVANRKFRRFVVNPLRHGYQVVHGFPGGNPMVTGTGKAFQLTSRVDPGERRAIHRISP